MSVDKTDTINKISKAININFSDEQRAVLEQPTEQALLVNACAGSGKTTLFMTNVLVEQVAGVQPVDTVLGITFSRKARKEMEDRYQKYVKMLQKQGMSVTGMPRLQTFHALFLSLLKSLPQYNTVNVLSSWTKYYLELAKSFEINSEHTDKTKRDYLDDIFNTYDYLINLGFSYDGIHLNHSLPYIKAIAPDPTYGLKDVFPLIDAKQYDEDYVDNYLKVITKYQQLKRNDGLIDFNDMMVLLLRELYNKQNIARLRSRMAKYRKVYIDEFQDIDALQWIIIKNILSPEAMKRIFVVGDDDQSIYGFRGSSSYYITKFATKLVPSAKVMNLSTNYRTGENILNAAVPMIQNNQSRLDKTLAAFNKGVGKITVFDCDNGFIDNPFLNKLLDQISDAKANKETVAVLARYNFDKMLIRDYLATKNIYTDSSTGLLQENRMYNNMIGLMRAIKDDSVVEFNKLSNIVGFKKLNKYLWKVFYNDPQHGDEGLLKFLHVALNNLRHNKRDYRAMSNKSTIEDTIDEISAYKYNVKQYKNNNYSEDQPLEEQTEFHALWDCVYQITYNYYKYMIEHNFISSANYNEMVDYIEYLSLDTSSFDDFQVKEEDKINNLKQKSKYSVNVELLTIHQAKGLEYNHVFLYGFTAGDIDDSLIKLSDTFSSDMTFSEFETEFNALAEQHDLSLLHYLSIMANAGVELADDIIHDMCPKGEVNYLVRLFKKDNYREQFIDSATQIKYEVFPLEERDYRILYHSLTTLCNAVEEERRILYVGITRAKKNCYIEYRGDQASPLLDELSIPDDNRISAKPDRKEKPSSAKDLEDSMQEILNFGYENE